MNPDQLVQFFKDNPKTFQEYIKTYFTPDDFVEEISLNFEYDTGEWEAVVNAVNYIHNSNINNKVREYPEDWGAMVNTLEKHDTAFIVKNVEAIQNDFDEDNDSEGVYTHSALIAAYDARDKINRLIKDLENDPDNNAVIEGDIEEKEEEAAKIRLAEAILKDISRLSSIGRFIHNETIVEMTGHYHAGDYDSVNYDECSAAIENTLIRDVKLMDNA